MLSEQKIEDALGHIFAEPRFKKEPAGLYDPLRYMIAIGGKRIRPRLCLLTYSLYRDSLDDTILQPACGLEVFHSFTLIHDDIMDRSPLRRKVDTVWKKWGEDTAILSGDVMCIESYRRIAAAPADKLPQVLGLFTSTAMEVCEGQQFDMDFERVPKVSMSDYMKMIGLKTGVLIACAAKMGAMIAGAPEEDCENLYSYGHCLGLAFQVADDYLDAYGDEKVFGKPIGGDIVNGKKCWLTTYALENADPDTEEALLAALALPSGSEAQKKEKIDKVKSFYEALNVKEAAKAEIARLTEKALEFAAKSCGGEKMQRLHDYAARLVGRTF